MGAGSYSTAEDGPAAAVGSDAASAALCSCLVGSEELDASPAAVAPGAASLGKGTVSSASFVTACASITLTFSGCDVAMFACPGRSRPRRTLAGSAQDAVGLGKRTCQMSKTITSRSFVFETQRQGSMRTFCIVWAVLRCYILENGKRRTR